MQLQHTVYVFIFIFCTAEQNEVGQVGEEYALQN